MRIIFDYLIFYIYSTYHKFGERDIPLLYSITILSVLQGFNVIVFIEVINLYIYDIDFLLIKKWVFIVFGVVMVMNAYFYWYKKRAILVLKKFNNVKYKKVKYLLFTYIAITIFSIIFIANLKRASVIG